MMPLVSRQECIVYHSEQSLIVRVWYTVVVQCVDLYGTHKSHKSFQPLEVCKLLPTIYLPHTLSRLPSDTLYSQLHVHVHYSTNLKSLCNLCRYVHAQSLCVHVFQLPLMQQGNHCSFLTQVCYCKLFPGQFPFYLISSLPHKVVRK